jgi:hypothetical protein
MQSHRDSDFVRYSSGKGPSPVVQQFMEQLEHRAAELKGAGKSKITGGADGEPTLAEWEANGVWCRQLPADEQGILRVSIGGGEGLPVSLNYCSYRGDRGRCIDLLRKALKALETDPS